MIKYNLKDIRRSIETIICDMKNIINASSKDYQVRIKQFFARINEDDVLNEILRPYLELKIEDKNLGFHNTCGYNIEYTIPENEEIEIACLLQQLNMHVNDKNFLNIFLSMYHKDKHDYNISNFNSDIVSPCFEKIERKLRYKFEDLQEENVQEVDNSKIMIINIKDTNNSNIAINNSTINNIDIFERVKQEIEEKIDNSKDREELLKILKDIKENTGKEETLKEKYNNFVGRLGAYAAIITPFLPKILEALGI